MMTKINKLKRWLDRFKTWLKEGNGKTPKYLSGKGKKKTVAI